VRDALDIVRHPRARRTRLSVDPASGRVRLTVPRRAALRDALAWAEEKREWIAEQQAKDSSLQAYQPGEFARAPRGAVLPMPVGVAPPTLSAEGR
jgi:predicted metal-dependent hydrolase